MEAIINVQNLSYKVGQKYLLDHINWQVAPGENWIIFGLNGSGKTTLLSIVAGFTAFSEGQLEVFGERYTAENVLALRRQVGWISSSFFDKYFCNETVLAVVLSGLSGSFGLIDTISNEEVRRAKAILAELQIDDKLDRPYAHLSKGERQSVLIARALITAPKLLLLDEPDNGLDVYARDRMRNAIRTLAKQQEITVVYITHYPENILPDFNHCMLLRHGKIYAQGATSDLLTSARVSALLGQETQVSARPSGGYEMILEAPSALWDLCYKKEHEGGALHGNL